MEGSCARTKGKRLLDQAIVAAGACITLAGRANGHCSLSDQTDALVESPFARRTQLSEAHGVLVQQRLKRRSLVVPFLAVRKIELVSRFGTGDGDACARLCTARHKEGVQSKRQREKNFSDM